MSPQLLIVKEKQLVFRAMASRCIGMQDIADRDLLTKCDLLNTFATAYVGRTLQPCDEIFEPASVSPTEARSRTVPKGIGLIDRSIKRFGDEIRKVQSN